MKKILLLMGVAAMTLASCSQEEVLSVNTAQKADNQITFRVRSKAAARSIEYSTANLDAFKVFGYIGWPDELVDENLELADDNLIPFFKDGEAVEFTRGEDGLFTSATPYYYPGDGSMMHFSAFAPASLNVEAIPYGGYKLDYTVDADITKQLDIICSEAGYSNDDVLDGGNLELDFRHALTKVFVSELRNTNKNFKIEVVGVMFGNVDESGELVYCGEKALTNTSQNEEFAEDGYIADGDGRIFWKPAGEQTASFKYILDAPVVLDGTTTTSVQLMSGEDSAENSTKKEAFMMVPQQLTAGYDAEAGKIVSFASDNSYIAFLVRITNVASGRVEYPFADGVENITETIGGVEYAWAAFPVATLWVPGLYVDYLVDFSKGAGYVAPGAEDYVVLKPIIGNEVKFTTNVMDWDNGGFTSITHDNEITVDVADDDDPFGE